MLTLMDNSARMTIQTQEVSESQPATAPITRAQRLVKKTAVKLKGINEIKQLKKMTINAKRKKEEEEVKRKKDEEEALRKAEKEKTKALEEENKAKNLHNVMNRIEEGKDIMDGN